MKKIIKRYRNYKLTNTFIKSIYIFISFFNDIYFFLVKHDFTHVNKNIKNVAIFCPSLLGDLVL
jgi:hypothetical protein